MIHLGPRPTIREPWTLDISKQAIGRAGEFQAAAIFELHGIITTHVDIYGVDLWVQTPSGRRVTVQVKTTRCPQKYKENRTPRYTFQIYNAGSGGADVYCFVALDLGLFRLLSSGELPKTRTKCYAVAQFTQELLEEDIRRYLY